jgi:hypothetical protein
MSPSFTPPSARPTSLHGNPGYAAAARTDSKALVGGSGNSGTFALGSSR